MEREEALALLEQYVSNKNLVKHSLACEVIMEHLAQFLGEDKVLWSMAGLLHDIDYELTKGDPQRHGIVGAEILAQAGLPVSLVSAVRAHNEMTGYQAMNRLEKALWAVDPTSGFIVACVLVHPTKSIKEVDVPFLLSRFREKSFARGAKREQMRSCEDIGLTLEEFLRIALSAMQERSALLEL
jgi:putative nucleotidyltransferase with HDIG domain